MYTDLIQHITALQYLLVYSDYSGQVVRLVIFYSIYDEYYELRRKVFSRTKIFFPICVDVYFPVFFNFLRIEGGYSRAF